MEESVGWGILIVVMSMIIAGAFLFTDQPIVGNSVLDVSQNTCEAIDHSLLSFCAEECTKIRRCPAYTIDCSAPTQIGCVCIQC